MCLIRAQVHCTVLIKISNYPLSIFFLDPPLVFSCPLIEFSILSHPCSYSTPPLIKFWSCEKLIWSPEPGEVLLKNILFSFCFLSFFYIIFVYDIFVVYCKLLVCHGFGWIFLPRLLSQKYKKTIKIVYIRLFVFSFTTGFSLRLFIWILKKGSSYSAGQSHRLIRYSTGQSRRLIRYTAGPFKYVFSGSLEFSGIIIIGVTVEWLRDTIALFHIGNYWTYIGNYWRQHRICNNIWSSCWTYISLRIQISSHINVPGVMLLRFSLNNMWNQSWKSMHCYETFVHNAPTLLPQHVEPELEVNALLPLAETDQTFMYSKSHGTCTLKQR